MHLFFFSEEEIRSCDSNSYELSQEMDSTGNRGNKPVNTISDLTSTYFDERIPVPHDDSGGVRLFFLISHSYKLKANSVLEKSTSFEQARTIEGEVGRILERTNCRKDSLKVQCL